MWTYATFTGAGKLGALEAAGIIAAACL